MREMLAAKAAALLQKHGFGVNSFMQCNSCFDLAAKRGNEVFLVKVFGNVDALREEQAMELKRIAGAFNAVALVIGEKTKALDLKNGVVYTRYGLQVLNLGSFADLLDDVMPSARFFKGKETVRLDAEKLRQKRKQLGLTLSGLAQRIDSSTQAVHRFETSAHSTLSAAKKLENALHTKLIKEINVFEEKPIASKLFDDRLLDESFEKMHDLGLKLALFEHAPFRAYSKPEEALLIDKGYSKQDLKRKALVLERAKKFSGGHSVIISKEHKYKSIQNTPIIQEEELESFSKVRDLLETIKEREKKKQAQG